MVESGDLIEFLGDPNNSDLTVGEKAVVVNSSEKMLHVVWFKGAHPKVLDYNVIGCGTHAKECFILLKKGVFSFSKVELEDTQLYRIVNENTKLREFMSQDPQKLYVEKETYEGILKRYNIGGKTKC